MSRPSLFDTFPLGATVLGNRVVMAPLTRSRATAEGVPTGLMEVYYAQRAGAGLIVSEGIVVSPQGAAYPQVPGLYDDDQVRAWRRITDGVHAQGGVIYAQLWHVGRQSHSSAQPDGLPPWAPSAVPVVNHQYYRKPDRLPYETPRALTREGIRAVISDFAAAAARAVRAGFDGVELHGANGYLIDQFLNSGSNVRTDEYGGSIANRVRFLHELVDAVGEQIPLDQVGVRLSPSSRWMDAQDGDKTALHTHVVDSLSAYGLAYLHLVEPEIAGAVTVDAAHDAVPTALLSGLFQGPVLVTGGHTLASAQRLLEEGTADLVGFGRAFIANPDLPQRLRTGHPLTPPEPKGFYAGGARGYITYPTVAEEQRWAELEDRIRAGNLDVVALYEELSAHDSVQLARDGDLYSFTRLQALLPQTSRSTP